MFHMLSEIAVVNYFVNIVDFLKKHLIYSVKNNRLSHSQMFLGGPSSSKLSIVFAFAGDSTMTSLFIKIIVSNNGTSPRGCDYKYKRFINSMKLSRSINLSNIVSLSINKKSLKERLSIKPSTKFFGILFKHLVICTRIIFGRLE